MNGWRTQHEQCRKQLLRAGPTLQETQCHDGTARTETGSKEVPERNSLDRRYQSCMAMTRHAPTEHKGGDLKGRAYKANKKISNKRAP